MSDAAPSSAQPGWAPHPSKPTSADLRGGFPGSGADGAARAAAVLLDATYGVLGPSCGCCLTSYCQTERERAADRVGPPLAPADDPDDLDDPSGDEPSYWLEEDYR